jgi:glutamate-1-semialdehyde 2,1-aminomutase
MSAEPSGRPGRQITLRSEALLERARRLFPGGVNNPSRAFRAVADMPRFIARAEGCTLIDVDQNRYVDLMMARGALILGHADPGISAAMHRALLRGANFDAPSEEEVLLGEKLVQWIPSMARLRFVHSAGEAVMGALRVARAFTGRAGVLKVEGHYHGDGDAVQRMAVPLSVGSGLADGQGVPDGALRDTWTVPYNDIDGLRRFFKRHPGEIAAMILEPVATSMGVVPPRVGYLQSVRELTLHEDVILIFDEISTGFRLERGGAQEFYGVIPDLTCLGKILGAGVSVGAFGGREDLMGLVAPQGPVFQSGGFAGSPPAMAAGLAVLESLEDKRAYAQLEAKAAHLESGLTLAAAEARVLVQVQRVGSMLTLFFSEQPVTTWADAARCHTRRFAAFARSMYSLGVYVPPGQYEAMYLSLAHTDQDLDRVIAAAREALQEAARV